MAVRGIASASTRPGIAAVLCIAPIAMALAIAAANPGMQEAVSGALPMLARYCIVILLPALLLWTLARAAGRPLEGAAAVALAGIVAFVAFAGVAQAAAYLLLLSIALILGSFLHRPAVGSGGDVFTAMLAGLGAIGGCIGWLLPLPIHSPALYLAASALVLLAGRERLVASARPMLQSWSEATRTQPLAACFAVAVIGLAAVPAWLPSLNPDDNSAHLLMARDLLAGSYYRIDASSQVFAVAPWLNNVLHAITSVLAGGESRSVIGLGWLVAGCVGAYRVACLLGARGPFPWLAAALYASHPLTAYFGMTLQVDGASAALLMHLVAACIALRRDEAWTASPWVIGALCGMLAGLKITNAVYLLVLGSWLIWHHASMRQYRRLAILLVFAAVAAGSSYFYATVITGNPLFPLFNGFFKSPYMAAIDFSDPRWHTGVGLDAFWKMTFATPSYMESYIGAAGLSVLALLGAWLVSLAAGGWRAALTAFAFATGLVVLFQVQYLRYIFPALGLLGTLAVVALSAQPWRRTAVASLVALVLVQCGLIRTTSWILTAGAAEQLLKEGPRAVARVEQAYVPERALVRSLDATGRAYCLLFADLTTSYVALAPSKSLVTGFYDPRMNEVANKAATDPTGSRWKEAIERIGITHVEFRPGQARPGLLPALESLGFALHERRGEAEVWARQGADPGRCLTTTLAPRDEARRLLR
ncbi:MAG TPA: hypothetical protein VN205_05640 [Thermomonas sp.]|nr:hypothetical protein [Thermomonas sp.]